MANKKRLEKKQAIALKWLHSLRVMIALLQKHRGQSTAFLTGDQSAQASIDNLQVKINGSCNDINGLEEAEDSPQWREILSRWNQVRTQYRQSSVQENIFEQSVLVKQLIHLLEDYTEDNGLLRVSGLEEFAKGATLRKLLSVIEYMGQARAYGMIIIVSQKCDSVERIKIHYLHDKIESIYSDLTQQLPIISQSRDKVTKYVNCLGGEILNVPPTLSKAEYFEMGTQAIEALYTHFDEIITVFNDNK